MSRAPGKEQMTIVGLGLIGGSLGMAVRRSELGYLVVGHDLHHEAAGHARRLGAVDRAEWNLPAAVESADVVVVATPARAAEGVFRAVAPHLKPGCVVTDVASTKARILAWAEEILPPTASFVGGHPMAGKEKSGVEAADPALFAGCTYCVVPGARAPAAAVDRIVSLATAIGARPFFVDPAEHDSFVAAVSHLPFLLSTALVGVTSQSPSWRDLARLAATGFRDVTRLASGDPEMHRDICLTNQEAILRWIEAFGAELQELAREIREGDAQLEATFRAAKEARDAWLRLREAPSEAPEERQSK